MDVLDVALDEANIDAIVAVALENDISAMTIRCGVDAGLQPRLQGSIGRQMRNRQGRRKAFLTRHTTSNHLLLCVQYPQRLLIPEIEPLHRGLDIGEVGRKTARHHVAT